jgi:predicted protein tyrosine phosphatase
MRFLIWSRQNAQDTDKVNTLCDVPHIWISIRNPMTLPADLPDNAYRKDTLFLSFDDIGEKSYWIGSDEYGRELVGCTESQAVDILDFVQKWQDQVQLICVNCEAGQSRSAGTAEALSLILNQHDSGIRDNPIYTPNSWVKTQILREARRRQYA